VKNISVALFLAFIFTCSCTLRASPEQMNRKNNDLFQEAIHDYYNGDSGTALAKLYAIESGFEDDPVFYEYLARSYFEIIKHEANIKTSLKEKDNNNKGVKPELEALFLKNIDTAIGLSEAMFQESQDPLDAYNFMMASAVKAWYLGEIKKQRSEPGKLFSDTVDKIYFCLDYDPQFCLAYFPLGITQYVIAKNMSWYKKPFYKMFAPSKLQKIINLDKEEGIKFLRYAAYCESGPEFRKIEARITLGLTLIDSGKKWDEKMFNKSIEAQEILGKLLKQFPNNKSIKNGLALADFRVTTYKERYEK